jgi:hypothetical protein
MPELLLRVVAGPLRGAPSQWIHGWIQTSINVGVAATGFCFMPRYERFLANNSMYSCIGNTVPGSAPARVRVSAASLAWSLAEPAASPPPLPTSSPRSPALSSQPAEARTAVHGPIARRGAQQRSHDDLPGRFPQRDARGFALETPPEATTRNLIRLLAARRPAPPPPATQVPAP